MKSIVCVDLDGTLWKDEIIPQSAIDALIKAEENGHLIFANTGRARSSAWDSLEGVPLSGKIYSAGTELWLNDRRIAFHPFSREKAMRILDELKKLPIGISTEGSEKGFLNEQNRQFLLSHAGSEKAASRFRDLDDLDRMQPEDFDDIMKFSVCDLKPGMIDELLERENLQFTDFGLPDQNSLISGEITQKEFTKGTAFAEILSLLPEAGRTVAIGDSDNDLPMFEGADMAIAMANGTKKAREKADWITDRIDEDGLAHALEKLGLLD